MTPLVGVGVFAWRNGCFLIQRRARSCGTGKWTVPGGRLEYGESPGQAGAREVREETGMIVVVREPVAITSGTCLECGEFWVTIWLEASWVSGEPALSGEADAFQWCTFSDVPDGMPAGLWEPHWSQLRRTDWWQRQVPS